MFEEEFNECRRIEPEQKGDRHEPHEPPKQDTEGKQGGIRQEHNPTTQPQGNPEQHEQEGVEPEYEEEFEEDGEYDDDDYCPDFIQERLDNPPLWPGECKEDFLKIFESYDLEYPHGRPKTDEEFLLVYQATVLTVELLRYDCMKAAIVNSQQRLAAESVYRKTYEDLVGDGDPYNGKSTARKWSQRYFTDPEYRREFAAKLQTTGYGAGAVEAQAFLRALPTLEAVERLITRAEKRLDGIMKRLNARYALRHPEAKMPKSAAAHRNADKYKPTLPPMRTKEEAQARIDALCARLRKGELE